MYKTFFIVSLLLVVGAGCTNTEVSREENQIATSTSNAVKESSDIATKTSVQITGTETEESAKASPNVKTFAVSGDNFAFAPATISVNKGDTVRITLTNTEGFHDLKIDELDVASKKLNAGESETIEFVADQVGTFEYYCSVGSHRDMGMQGTLTVK